MKLISKTLIIIILTSFVIIGSNQASFSQRKLTKTERKLARKKDLDKFEMQVLLKKGLTLEKIEETPTNELREKFIGKRVILVDAYKECNEKVIQLEKKVTELDSINKLLNERIKVLENENSKK